MTTLDRTPPQSASSGPSGDAADVVARADGIHARAAVLHPRRFPVLRTTLLVGIALADVVLAVPAFNAALRSWTGFSVVCAIAFSLVTVLAAFTSGREYRRGHARLSVAAAAAAIAVIAGLFLLRLFAAGQLADTVAYEGGTAAGDEMASELVMATVLAVLMGATAVLAWLDGRDLTPSRDESALRQTNTALEAKSGQVAALEGVVEREKADRATAVYELRRIDPDLADALRALDALALELVELARYEVARHLGDPAATSGLDRPIRLDRTTAPEEEEGDVR